jgi:hypothetical protein
VPEINTGTDTLGHKKVQSGCVLQDGNGRTFAERLNQCALDLGAGGVALCVKHPAPTVGGFTRQIIAGSQVNRPAATSFFPLPWQLLWLPGSAVKVGAGFYKPAYRLAGLGDQYASGWRMYQAGTGNHCIGQVQPGAIVWADWGCQAALCIAGITFAKSVFGHQHYTQVGG